MYVAYYASSRDVVHIIGVFKTYESALEYSEEWWNATNSEYFQEYFVEIEEVLYHEY
jgi:hypothetical protein